MENLKVKDGKLYFLWETADGEKKAVLILPKVMREYVLKQLHDAPTARHLGVNRTLASARSSFYWFGMKGDIEDWALKCKICNSKIPSPKVKCAK